MDCRRGRRRPYERQADFRCFGLGDGRHGIGEVGYYFSGAELEVYSLKLFAVRLRRIPRIPVFRLFIRGISSVQRAGVGDRAFHRSQQAVGELCDGRVGRGSSLGFAGPSSQREPDRSEWEPDESRRFPKSKSGYDGQREQSSEQVAGTQIQEVSQDDSGQKEKRCVEKRNESWGCSRRLLLFGPSNARKRRVCLRDRQRGEYLRAGVGDSRQSFHSAPRQTRPQRGQCSGKT